MVPNYKMVLISHLSCHDPQNGDMGLTSVPIGIRHNVPAVRALHVSCIDGPILTGRYDSLQGMCDPTQRYFPIAHRFHFLR